MEYRKLPKGTERIGVIDFGFIQCLDQSGNLDDYISAGALDQACVDLIYAQKDGDGASLVSRIESRGGIHTLEHTEEIGLGSRT